MLILKINFIAKHNLALNNNKKKHRHSKYIALHHTLVRYCIMVAGSGLWVAIAQCLKGDFMYMTHASPMCIIRPKLATRIAVYYNLKK